MKKLSLFVLLLFLSFCSCVRGQSVGALQGFCDLGGNQAIISGLKSSNYLQGNIPHCTVAVYLHDLYSVSSAKYQSGGTVNGSAGQTCNATFVGGTSNGTGTIALTGTNTIQNGTAFTIPIPTGTYGTAPTTATLSNGTATCSGTANVAVMIVPALATIYSDELSTPLTNPFKATIIGPAGTGQWIFWAASGAQGYDVVLTGGDAPLTYPHPVTLTDLRIPGPGGGGSPISLTTAGTSGPSTLISNILNVPIYQGQLTLTTLGTSGPSTLIDDTLNVPNYATGGGGGGCGPVSGDNTSTDCGFGNQVDNTGTRVSTFGYSNVLDANASNKVTAVGTENFNEDFGAEALAVGNSNFTDVVFTNHANSDSLLSVGWFNGVHDDSVSTHLEFGLTYIGENNGGDIDGTGPSLIVAIGGGNVNNMVGGPSEIVGIGDSNLTNQAGTNNTVLETVGIGDNTCAHASGTQPNHQSGDDWVCIGNAAGLDIHPGSTDVVYIGDGAGAGSNGVLPQTSVADVVAIGDAAAKFNQGNNIVSVGNLALGSTGAVGFHNQGNEIVALGHYTLVINTTGTKNVGIGGYAGADGFVDGVTSGNANKTGSNDTWVGYDSGPGVTTQLTNAAAFGYQAHNTASNQAVIGGAAITQTIINGIAAHPTQTVVSSATTIAPTAQIFHVSGTTPIVTITAPAACTNTGYSCQLTIIPDGIFTTTTGGNIALASTAVVSRALLMTYDPATSKWYPSY